MYNLIITDIMKAGKTYLPASVIASLIIIILLYTIKRYGNRKSKRLIDEKAAKYSPGSIMVLFIFFIYAFLLIGIALLSREPGSRDAVHLQLFYIFSKNLWARTYATENVIMFIPFGVMLPLIWDKFASFKWSMLAAFLSSIVIEVIQFVTKRGFTELDDILNNMIGAVLGYGVFVVMRIIIGKLKTNG